MTPHASLKVFEPLEAFEGAEHDYWRAYVREERRGHEAAVLLSPEEGVQATLAVLEKRHVFDTEHADVLLLDQPYLCPHRVKLRLLASVVAFRRLIPPEASLAFMPHGDAERALRELERLHDRHPEWKSGVLTSTWEVRPHWYVAFSDGERELTGESIRYRAELADALARVAGAAVVLRNAMPGSGVPELVSELGRWLGQFHEASKVVLEYGDLGSLFPPEELVDDHSAADIQAALEALSGGRPDEAAAHYGVVGERWAAIRSLESNN